MQNPNLFGRVRMPGQKIPFFVIRVDEERREVDLIPVSGGGACFDAVPFAELMERPVNWMRRPLNKPNRERTGDVCARRVRRAAVVVRGKTPPHYQLSRTPACDL